MKFLFAAAAVMIAAAPVWAATGTASVALSGVVIELTPLDPSGFTWSYVPDHVDWVEAPAAATALVQDPPASQWATGWFGENLSASAAVGGAAASASLHYGSAWIGDAAALSAAASAGADQSASAYAQLYQGSILISAMTHVRLVATLDTLAVDAAGGSANAVASLALWDDSGFFAQTAAEWRETPDFSVRYTGPNQLVLEWDNTSAVDGRWLGVGIAAGADVLGAVSAVPEPGAFGLMAGGLALLAWRRRRATRSGLSWAAACLVGTAQAATPCAPSTLATAGAAGDDALASRTTVTAAAGTQVRLHAGSADAGGQWRWSGCGLASSDAGASFTASASCTARVVHTNRCGAQTSASVAVVVPGMRDLTSVQLTALMGAGWNLGNALEALPTETSWGNPPASQALLNAVRAAGFKSVRIPVSWNSHADADGNIDPKWMSRVAAVVGYARNAGLYAIVNIHWDNGWMVPDYAHQAAVNARLTKLWTQIATQFRNQDDMLLFAGTNEVHIDGQVGEPTAENVAVQNSFNQTFVDAVRATGGNNLARHLVVQAYNTNIDYALKYAVVPADSADRRLSMEVHFYDPYYFTLAPTYWNGTTDYEWQWGAILTDPAAAPDYVWANESYIDAQFLQMKTGFVDRGVGVVLGEYSAISRLQKDPAGTYRTYWDRYVTTAARRNGMVPIYWDNGLTKDHNSGLFNRSTGSQAFPKVIQAVISAAK